MAKKKNHKENGVPEFTVLLKDKQFKEDLHFFVRMVMAAELRELVDKLESDQSR